MFRETFSPIKTLEKEKGPIFYEEKMNNLENLKRQELKSLAEVERMIPKQKPEKRAEIGRKLFAYFLTTFIALGTAQESLLKKASAQAAPEKEITSILEKINVEELESQRFKDYQEFKKIVEQEKIEEKIGFLKKHYGQAIENFLSIHRINLTLEFFNIVKRGIEAGDPKILVNRESPTAMVAGSVLSNFFKEKWQVLSKEEKLEKSKEIEIKGFEILPQLSNEKIKKILQAIYPRQWLQGSIREIVFVPEITKDKKKEWFVFGQTEGYTLSTLLEKDIRASIMVFNIPKGHTLESILDTLDHEIAHANDWENSKLLSSQERINLLYEVTQRYNKKDRFKSKYVESIKEDDKFFKAYRKIKEYWAEIVQNYFRDKKTFKSNNPKDAELVEKWFNRINDIEEK